jgi:hypothetical protein
MDRYLCSQHAFEKVMEVTGEEARKLRLRPVK